MAVTHDSCDIFNSLAEKITQLSLGRTKNNRDLIILTLSDLNSLNYKYTVVTNPTKAVLLVNQCCTLIPPEDSELVAKCCHLITNLSLQNVIIDGRTLTVSVLWCLQVLKVNSAEMDCLVALDGLLRGSLGHNLIGEVIKCPTLMQLARAETKTEVTFFALQCLEACTLPHQDNKINDFELIFKLFLQHLSDINPEKLIEVKLAITCLRGLQNIVRQKSDLLSANLGLILGVIKSYMVVGLPHVEFIKPQKLLPSPLSIPESVPQTTREKGGKMTKQRKPKTQQAVMKQKSDKWDDLYTPATNFNTDLSFGNVKTSDSDVSDTENGNKIVGITSKLRQTALTLFLHTIKITDKNVIFSFWTSFLPENSQATNHHLITCILKETTNRGKMAALNTLLLLLSTCRLFLTQAEKGDNLAFTPFSVILGLTLHEIHKCLSLSLSAISIPVLTLVLKCFSALVQATPYHRLSSGLITKVTRNLKPLISHKDSTVQVTALIVLGCILASEPLIPETQNCFLKNEESEAIPWLLHRCLTNLGVNLNCQTFDNSTPTPVKLESLQIISVMSRNYFEIFLVPFLQVVTKALDFSLVSKYSDVQLHAGRAVDFMGQAINRSRQPNGAIHFWQIILNSLIGLLQSEQAILRATACDCLGSIGAIFEQLTRDKQILVITLLFSASRDEESIVKGAAVRALGISVLYQSLREDLGFVVDTSETILRVIHDENFTVRVKASWALGNLSDALVLNKSETQEEFPKSLTLKLLQAAIQASNDNDKIKMNAVRALGNLLQLIEGELIQERIVLEGIEILAKNCTSGSNMKVRWNSCHAIGNAMKNNSLFDLNWQENVFSLLAELVVNFRNFKVRINSAMALGVPCKREFYKHFYYKIWEALIKGLETSQIMEDFNEYKHRDNLIEQICLTLGHLISIMTREDLSLVKDSVHSEHLQVQMRRVWHRLVPEKSTVLVEAFNSLEKLVNLSREQNETRECLQAILKPTF